ncbi:uncharacterized protein LOC141638108 [Silene latifolia]|uniref:uncharacterized protein LOC141638108 n=1 Tax=Silene latifolia TaxID=37657 RepID=UPI003D7846FA
MVTYAVQFGSLNIAIKSDLGFEERKEYVLQKEYPDEPDSDADNAIQITSLRIVLKQERKEYVLHKEYPDEPDSDADNAIQMTYIPHEKDNIDVCCLILATTNSELQKQYENMDSAFDMINNLKAMFQEQARTERYNTVKAIFDFKMGDKDPVSPHVMKLISYFDNLERLDAGISQQLATDIILQSLPPVYKDFVLNYNMHDLQRPLQKLHEMLKTAEPNIKKVPTPEVLMVRKGKDLKGKGKGKGKAKVTGLTITKADPKPNTQKLPVVKKSVEDLCHYCNEKGALEEELCQIFGGQEEEEWCFHFFRCGSHICCNVQGLGNARGLEKGEVDLRVGNGARVAALAIGTFYLELPSGLVIELDNCYHVPAISRNIISVSFLDLKDFDILIKYKCCSVSLNGIVYCQAYIYDGLYGYVYLMKHKSESFEKFKEFQNEVLNQLGKTFKAIRSDRGGEYLSQDFGDHLRSCGIVSQLTPLGTPQWNGVSESRNRTLLDMVRSMMSHENLSISFWGYALETYAFTLNRCPSKSAEKTSYEIWTGSVPKLSFMKIWGCEAYVRKLIPEKLGPKSDKCIFVGYPKETKGYYFYNPAEHKVFVARN